MSSRTRHFPKVLPHQPEKRSTTPSKTGKYRWLFFVTVIGVGYWFIFYSSTFAVANVELEGTDAPAAHSVVQSLKGKNIFRLNSTSIEASLRGAYPPIASLSLVRGLPSTVRLSVALRQPELRWQVKDTLYILDATGELFDQGDKPEYQTLPKVIDQSGAHPKVGQRVVGSGFIEFIKSVNKEGPAVVKRNLVSSEVNDTTLLVDVLYEGDIRTRMTIQRPWKEQLDSISAILDAHPQAKLIDVRVPGWGYWK